MNSDWPPYSQIKGRDTYDANTGNQIESVLVPPAGAGSFSWTSPLPGGRARDLIVHFWYGTDRRKGSSSRSTGHSEGFERSSDSSTSDGGRPERRGVACSAIGAAATPDGPGVPVWTHTSGWKNRTTFQEGESGVHPARLLLELSIDGLCLLGSDRAQGSVLRGATVVAHDCRIDALSAAQAEYLVRSVRHSVV